MMKLNRWHCEELPLSQRKRSKMPTSPQKPGPSLETSNIACLKSNISSSLPLRLPRSMWRLDDESIFPFNAA